MPPLHKTYWLCLVLGCIVLSLCRCGNGNASADDETTGTEAADWPQIQARGKIIAATLYGSTSYFQYKMQPMGYEYDLVKDFAKTHDLELELKVARTNSELVEMLDNGEADLIAYPMPVSNRLKEKVIYCGHETISSQVLVQRANKGDTILKDVTELLGKEVYVKPKTKYSQRMHNLDMELGGGIQIHEVESDSIMIEDLIEMVSKGEIPYTVCDDYTARLNKTYYWNLNIDLKISFRQRSSWIVRQETPELAKAINAWATDKTGRRVYSATAKRYFELSKQQAPDSLPPIKDGHLSPYDPLFQKHAKLIGWDWQLIAAIAYQESRFNTHLVSWAGAEGLMGIMPNTAKALGITPHELREPDTSIRAGVDCLRRFRQGFLSITDEQEKILFTLAAYNAGIGHVFDARALAKKYGKNPDSWSDVSEYIRLKSNPTYYNDPVCKHGYLRGSETADYVDEVMERYHYYKKASS